MKKANNVRKRTKKATPRKKITYVAHDLPETGLVRLPTVLQFLGIGKSSWWNGVREGRYPKPVKLGPRTTTWRAEDIRRLHAGNAA